MQSPEADDPQATQVSAPIKARKSDESSKKVTTKRKWGGALFTRSSDLWLYFSNKNDIIDSEFTHTCPLDAAEASCGIGSDDANKDGLEKPGVPQSTHCFTFDDASNTGFKESSPHLLKGDPDSPLNVSFETADTYFTVDVASDNGDFRSTGVENASDLESPHLVTLETPRTSDNDGHVLENKAQKNLADKRRKDITILFVYGWVTIIGVAIFVAFVLLKQDKFEALKELGYPHTKELASGWLFDANPDTAPSSFSYYKSSDLVPNGQATDIDCARQCSTENAFAGAWNSFYLECWCYFEKPRANFCFEPCVVESGIEFSTQTFDDFEYCDESYCEIFDAGEYCEFRKYNPDLCLEFR